MRLFHIKSERQPEVMQIGEDLLGREWRLKPFLMTRHAFVFMLEGEAVFFLDDDKIPVRQGHSLFIREGTILSSQLPPHEPFRCSWIHFSSPGKTSEISDGRLRKIIRRVKSRDIAGDTNSVFILPEAGERDFYLPTVLDMGEFAGEIHSIMRMNFRERAMPTLNSSQMLSHGMSQILILLTRKAVSETCGENIRSVKSLPMLVQESLFIMQDKYNVIGSVSDIAGELHVTPQHLIRTFRKTLGSTPLAHLQGIRLRKSCELLRHSTLSIKEISFAVGYRDQRYFGRVFRNAMKSTPGSYRENL